MANSRKLRLQMDELRVETFETASLADARGTVHGREPAGTATGSLYGCECDTRENTCWGGCGPSQPRTCPGQCDGEDTMYLTCMASCGWEGGQAVEYPNC